MPGYVLFQPEILLSHCRADPDDRLYVATTGMLEHASEPWRPATTAIACAAARWAVRASTKLDDLQRAQLGGQIDNFIKVLDKDSAFYSFDNGCTDQYAIVRYTAKRRSIQLEAEVAIEYAIALANTLPILAPESCKPKYPEFPNLVVHYV